MATSGLMPELLAVLDSITAHRHWGLCFPMVRTAPQQAPDGAALGVLRRRRARRQPQRHPVRRRRPALARALGEARRGGEQEGEHKETPHPRHLTHTHTDTVTLMIPEPVLACFCDA